MPTRPLHIHIHGPRSESTLPFLLHIEFYSINKILNCTSRNCRIAKLANLRFFHCYGLVMKTTQGLLVSLYLVLYVPLPNFMALGAKCLKVLNTKIGYNSMQSSIFSINLFLHSIFLSDKI